MKTLQEKRGGNLGELGLAQDYIQWQKHKRNFYKLKR